MEFDWSPEEEAFRQEVREFLSKELTDDVRGSMFVDSPARIAFGTQIKPLHTSGISRRMARNRGAQVNKSNASLLVKKPHRSVSIWGVS